MTKASAVNQAAWKAQQTKRHWYANSKDGKQWEVSPEPVRGQGECIEADKRGELEVIQ